MGVDKGPVPLFKESRIASASAESATHLPNQEAHSPSNGGFQRPQPLKRGAKSSVLIRRNWIGRRNSPAIPTSSVNVIASIVKTGPRRCFSRFPHASTVGFSKRRSHAHPLAPETEFRLTDPLPKRCANFGNESRRGGGKIRSSKFEIRNKRGGSVEAFLRPAPHHSTATLRRCWKRSL
jgi:hypothetical protein